MQSWWGGRTSSRAAIADSVLGLDKRRSIPTWCSPSSRRCLRAPRSHPGNSGNRNSVMTFEFPRAKQPEEVGLSSKRLARLTDALRADIDTGAIPGAVVLVARRGKIACLEALGYRDREVGAAMAP